MVTKPQDIIVALKLALGATASGYADLGVALGMSASEVHAAVRRLIQARLIDPETKRVRLEALRNFLVHGVPHAFPANLEEITRGMPTAWAAPAMSGMISSSDQLPPVWPDPEGRVQGTSVQPLYPSAPGAARRDPPPAPRPPRPAPLSPPFCLLLSMLCESVERANERSPKKKSINA